jgi:hypothetical protein
LHGDGERRGAAATVESAQNAAFEACLTHVHAAALVTAVDDGRGGSLVWLTDRDNNLWLCNADADGHVYAYSMIFDDLLAGAGASLVTPIILDREGKSVSPPPDPLATAELACRAYLDGEGGEVVARGADRPQCQLAARLLRLPRDGGRRDLSARCDRQRASVGLRQDRRATRPSKSSELGGLAFW